MHDDATGTSMRRWVGPAVGLAAAGTLLYALWKGLPETLAALRDFDWRVYPLVLALTLVNYGLRYWKWHWMLGRLGIHVPHRQNAHIFLCGLAMVISPGKAGELVKPWLVKQVTGAPLAATVPVLFAERATDGIAVIALTAVGASTFAAKAGFERGGEFLAVLVLGFVAFLAVLAFDPLAQILFAGLTRVHVRLAAAVETSWGSLRTCLSPASLVALTLVSIVAWWAECVGCWLVLRGMGAEASLDASTFLYAGATVLGGPSPGGLGVADVALAEGAVRLVPGLTAGASVAASLLTRVATLWLGVGIGALLFMRLDVLTKPSEAIREGGG